jgi:hypothetical protein
LLRRPPLVVLVVAICAAVAVLSVAGAANAKTVWLCRPGLANDPCTPGLTTTNYSPAGRVLGVEHPTRAKHPAIDCFYVYPTVSGQPTGNSNLHVDPEERSIALFQTARYSQYCRVFAPMYRQVTLAGIGIGHPTTARNPALALADVRSAFRDYLEHYNGGRGFVLIGHSQGSFELRSMMALDIDPKPAVRKRLVSAIVLGGNVLVQRRTGVGGDFKHIPACHDARQLGCVVAFSTFDQPVPPGSVFGHANGVLGPAAKNGEVVLCTNPAALGGGSALTDLILPSQPFAPGTLIAAGIGVVGLKLPTPPTVWISEPGSYRARCASSNGANVLEVTPVGGAQVPKPSPDATWGLHLLDPNIALGNLIEMVQKQAAEWVESQTRARKR